MLIEAYIVSPVGNVIGRTISPGTEILSLQWIRVSSISKTNVLKCFVLGNCTILSS